MFSRESFRSSPSEMFSKKDLVQIRSKHWRRLMIEEYFLFVHHTTSILAKLNTWCFEHSDEISCSLLVNPSYTDEYWEGRNMCLWIHTYIKDFIEIIPLFFAIHSSRSFLKDCLVLRN